jgi:hypothetical protein
VGQVAGSTVDVGVANRVLGCDSSVISDLRSLTFSGQSLVVCAPLVVDVVLLTGVICRAVLDADTDTAQCWIQRHV